MTICDATVKSIGVVSAYRMFGAGVQPTGLSHTRTFLTGRDACRIVLADGIYLFGSPTTVMFRADLVRGRAPFYAEGRLFEDAEVCFELLAGCDFGFVHQVLSFTRTENDSLWRGMRGYNGWLLGAPQPARPVRPPVPRARRVRLPLAHPRAPLPELPRRGLAGAPRRRVLEVPRAGPRHGRRRDSTARH